MNDLSFAPAWAVTATIAAAWYAYKAAHIEKRMLWNIKMLLKMAANEAKVTRECNTLTFHYENDMESNTITIGIK